MRLKILGASLVAACCFALMLGLVVSSDKVPEPVAVRYAFRAYSDGVNVYNAAGLPMVPFRTDSFDCGIE